tara:strand:- start:1267 stop:2304 length:1038 start_codon:yes stop_codon:yes gene_type:complete
VTSNQPAHGAIETTDAQPVLRVTDLTTQFDTQDGMVHAVNGVSFELADGEVLGVVGESGSGKSVTMMSLLRLIPMPPGEIVAGEAIFEGRDLLAMDLDELRLVRGGKVGFIFQDPMTSLNPVLTVGYQIMESLRIHQPGRSTELGRQALELLQLVGIPSPEERLRSFPHELSGGMRQRVMIAIALACRPRILVADEPTTALDVTIQAQILELVKRLRRELGMAVIWITHDLGVVAGLVDRVVVMYAGRIVEDAPVDEFYASPQHPYSRGLLASLPSAAVRGQKLVNIEGQPPDMRDRPTSCSFAPRCPHVHDRCHREDPALVAISGTRRLACWWDIDEDGPRVHR